MNRIQITDTTIQQAGKAMTFREKLEIAKLLDKLGVSVITLREIENLKIDSLLIKSVAGAVKGSTVAVPVALNEESVHATWDALRTAASPRLQVCAAVSTVQMEYLYHKKPEGMLEAIASTVKACADLCGDVEFIAEDATRSEESFLDDAIRTAIAAGAKTITVCDTAGILMPDEIAALFDGLMQRVPELSGVMLSFSASNALAMADACSVAAIWHGAREVKAAAFGESGAKLENVARIVAARGEARGVASTVRMTEISRLVGQIAWLCQSNRSKNSPFDNGVREDTDLFLTAQDDRAAVQKAVERLGYDLSEEDVGTVYEAFCNIAAKKEQVGFRELDAIVASAALQVPPTYVLESYVINTGNIITATAHIRMKKNGQLVEGVSVGDGGVDAAFLALEQIVGHHYELDDFQIQAVTEGREAMAQTVVKLRAGGKLYSGRGISTDVLGASIRAYVNALNKIVYEEAEV